MESCQTECHALYIDKSDGTSDRPWESRGRNMIVASQLNRRGKQETENNFTSIMLDISSVYI